MSLTGISTLDNATQDANIWLNEISAGAHWGDKKRSYRLLRATLHALRDWLNSNEAADLGAQLPMLIRGIYYEGWNPSATPLPERKLEAFYDRVQRDFKMDPLGNPQLSVSAVFAVLSKHITKGEIDQIRNTMRKDLRDLWPSQGDK